MLSHNLIYLLNSILKMCFMQNLMISLCAPLYLKSLLLQVRLYDWSNLPLPGSNSILRISKWDLNKCSDINANFLIAGNKNKGIFVLPAPGFNILIGKLNVFGGFGLFKVNYRKENRPVGLQ